MKISYRTEQKARKERMSSISMAEKERAEREKAKNEKLKASQSDLQALAKKTSQVFWEFPILQSVIKDWEKKFWKRSPDLAPVDLIDRASTYRCPWYPEGQVQFKERMKKFVMNYARERKLSKAQVEVFELHLDAWDPYAE